jgi:hypothetical protein
MHHTNQFRSSYVLVNKLSEFYMELQSIQIFVFQSDNHRLGFFGKKKKLKLFLSTLYRGVEV